MDSITSLRKYRFDLENLGQNTMGIALFDFASTFLVAYILNQIFNFTSHVESKTYYLLLIPISILVHLIFGIDSFLLQRIHSSGINIYKIIVLLMLVGIFI